MEDENFHFEVEITFKVSMPWISDRALYFIYIPSNNHASDVCHSVMRKYKEFRKTMGILDIKTGHLFGGDIKIGCDEQEIKDTLYIYTENPINDPSSFKEKSPLDSIAKELGITVYLREEAYRKERERSMKLLAFISHDSRDKELIARPIAQALTHKLFKVWFDEYSLKVGDNLRESIEHGIQESNKCILILTPNFLSNPGWTKKEFDSIFTKEMVKRQNIILPIWYNVSVDDVYNYSPSLANTVALHWPEKEKMSEQEYKAAIERITSEIINQLDKPVV